MVKSVKDRALAAYKKAHPSCPYGLQVHKNRNRQIIRVRGYEAPDSGYGVVAEWSYADDGKLKRIS